MAREGEPLSYANTRAEGSTMISRTNVPVIFNGRVTSVLSPSMRPRTVADQDQRPAGCVMVLIATFGVSVSFGPSVVLSKLDFVHPQESEGSVNLTRLPE